MSPESLKSYTKRGMSRGKLDQFRLQVPVPKELIVTSFKSSILPLNSILEGLGQIEGGGEVECASI
jgi:hypothetical protein